MTRAPAESQPRIIAALVCAAAGAAVFQFYGNANQGYIVTDSLFWWWVYQWINPASETEHGWLILAISVWLTWRNLRIADCGLRNADRAADSGAGQPPITPIETGRPTSSKSENQQVSGLPSIPQSAIPNPQSIIAAFAAMIAALALHAVGFAAQQARVSILALLLFAWGVIRLVGGRRWGVAAMFPLGFLVFAIPFSGLDTVGFWLRLWVINVATPIAHAAGIDVVQNGTQLFSPDGRYNYDVAAACSGIRSLVAMAALSLLIGYLRFRSWWRRGLLLALCFPLAYLGNLVRITSIVFAAEVGGPEWGTRAHDAMGYGIFVIVLGGVLAASALLERWAPDGPADGIDVGGVPSPRALSGAQTEHAVANGSWNSGRLGTAAPAIVGGVICVLAVGEMLFLHRLATMPPRGRAGVALAADGRNPIELPTFLGRDWVGMPAPVTTAERQILPPDTGYSRMHYVATRDGQRVFLSIVLSGRDRTSIHRPELCLLGQGWTIRGRGVHTFQHPAGPEHAFRATLLRVEQQHQTARGASPVPQLVAYWFVSGDDVVPSYAGRMVRDAVNRVFRARADRWAYVLMQTDAMDGQPAALERMQAVLKGTLPVFSAEPLKTGSAKAPNVQTPKKSQ